MGGGWIVRSFMNPAGVGEVLLIAKVAVLGKGLYPTEGNFLGHGIATGAKAGECIVAGCIPCYMGFAGVTLAVVVIVKIGDPVAEDFLVLFTLGVMVLVEPEISM